MTALADYLQKRIRTEGPLSFRDYMEAVLYHPQLGYYTSGVPRIGSQGDFYTSSDVDSVFGKLLARHFQELSRDFEDFTLVELGAGKGLLARDILQVHSFPYLILERSPALRDHQRAVLEGLDVQWIDSLPPDLNGCVFSNEFFDALPVHRFVGRSGRVKEIFVGDGFREIEAEPSVKVGLELGEGQLADINLEATSWIRRIAQSLKRGFHLAIDYGYLREEFYAHNQGTLMCYWRHQANENPYVHIGEQDVTAHVNFSDLIDEGQAHGLRLMRFSNQMDFLVQAGILEEMQQLADASDLASTQRLLRMKNLIVPDRMGERFKVLLQQKVDA